MLEERERRGNSLSLKAGERKDDEADKEQRVQVNERKDCAHCVRNNEKRLAPQSKTTITLEYEKAEIYVVKGNTQRRRTAHALAPQVGLSHNQSGH